MNVLMNQSSAFLFEVILHRTFEGINTIEMLPQDRVSVSEKLLVTFPEYKRLSFCPMNIHLRGHIYLYSITTLYDYICMWWDDRALL